MAPQSQTAPRDGRGSKTALDASHSGVSDSLAQRFNKKKDESEDSESYSYSFRKSGTYTDSATVSKSLENKMALYNDFSKLVKKYSTKDGAPLGDVDESSDELSQSQPQ